MTDNRSRERFHAIRDASDFPTWRTRNPCFGPCAQVCRRTERLRSGWRSQSCGPYPSVATRCDRGGDVSGPRFLHDRPADQDSPLQEGDPKRFRLPSMTLSDHLKGTPLGDYPKSLSLYFLISDRYLPPEFHKRVYLFGSLYRVYVDLRFLLAVAGTLGISSGLMIASRKSGFDPTPSFDGDASLWTIAVIGSVLLAGSYGVAFYSFAVMAKYDVRELGRRLRREAMAIAGCCVGLLLLGFLGTALLLSGELLLGLIGQILAVGAIALWTWVEIGPPAKIRWSYRRSFDNAREAEGEHG